MVTGYPGESMTTRVQILLGAALAGTCIIPEIVLHGIYHTDVFFQVLFIIPVVAAGMLLGRPGVLVSVAAGGTYLAISLYMDEFPVLLPLVFFLFLLATSLLSAVIRERIDEIRRILSEFNRPPGAEGDMEPGPFGTTMHEISYCILPRAQVRRMKERHDINGLVLALSGRDVGESYEAAEALGDLKDVAAVAPLIHVIEEDRYTAVSWKAAEGLAKIGNAATGPLIRLLSHSNEDVRWKAALALGEIGDEDTIVPLIRLLSDNDHYVQGRAAAALGMIGRPASGPLIDALLSGDTSTRRGAAIALGKIHDPRAIAPLIRTLGDKDENVREEARTALGAIEDEHLDLLIRILDHAADEEIRSAGGAKKGSPDILSSLKQMTRTDRDLRGRVVAALRRVNDPVLDPLIEDLIEDGV
jgi:HEAT repeat protein